MREALRLSHLPVHLTVARDGVEASRYLHQIETNSAECPDLVLLDLNLPRKNGREVLAEIKRSRHLQAMPVVILTSSNLEEEQQQAHALRAAGFLLKPSGLPAYMDLVLGLERFWADSFELSKTA